MGEDTAAGKKNSPLSYQLHAQFSTYANDLAHLAEYDNSPGYSFTFEEIGMFFTDAALSNRKYWPSKIRRTAGQYSEGESIDDKLTKAWKTEFEKRIEKYFAGVFFDAYMRRKTKKEILPQNLCAKIDDVAITAAAETLEHYLLELSRAGKFEEIGKAVVEGVSENWKKMRHRHPLGCYFTEYNNICKHLKAAVNSGA